MRQIKPIVWGLAIIILGVIFGGNALGLFDINIFFDGWWTLFIIVPSFISLFTEKEKVGNLVFLACGVVLLLAAQEFFSYDIAWKVILAGFLVLTGMGIIFKSIFHNKKDKEIEEKIEKIKDDKKLDSQIAIFSGSDKSYSKEEFPGTNLVAVFGGIDLDLREAVIKQDVVIKAFCLFGGIDIRVPDDVQIKIKSGFIFGGIGDSRKVNTEKTKYTIYIDAAGGFGGVDIKDKAKK